MVKMKGRRGEVSLRLAVVDRSCANSCAEPKRRRTDRLLRTSGCLEKLANSKQRGDGSDERAGWELVGNGRERARVVTACLRPHRRDQQFSSIVDDPRLPVSSTLLRILLRCRRSSAKDYDSVFYDDQLYI
ncbi:hypothetical protein OF83DRAFT_371457 [Amylostereum chailletii]|nr:hypothetical protein OF83DRAFT_371457 [Amylostereum chailletii]